MKRVVEFYLAVILILWTTSAFADTTWVHIQNIDDSITWTPVGNPYIIKGGVMVDSGGILVIEPGVKVYFDTIFIAPSSAGFKVVNFGKLIALGTKADSIYFSPRDTTKNLGNIYVSGLAKFKFCKFTHMRSNSGYGDAYGGAIHFEGSENGSEIDHCYFAFNMATDGGGALTVKAAVPCGVSMGYAEIHDSYFYKNYSQNGGGSIILEECAFAHIYKNIFAFNSGDTIQFLPLMGSPGGAIFIMEAANSGKIANNYFIGNAADLGGAIYTENPNIPIENNIFYSNYAKGSGGAIFTATVSNMVIPQNTIVANRAGISCGGIGLSSSNVTIKNTIIYDNIAPNNPQINNSPSILTYSDIQGGYSGTGNIDADPLFVDTANGDFHLTCQSPCIDSGDPADSLDPDFTRRDMGAYYFHHTYGSGDVNNDCHIIGGDVTFFVRYLKGIGSIPYPIWKADSNADCSVQGADVTYLVRYFKGIGNPPSKNPNCLNPEWSIPDTCGACSY